MDWSSIPGASGYLLSGLWITIKITTVAVLAGIVWGSMLAVMRLFAPKPIAWLAALYVNLFRGIPLVMVLLWFYLIIGPSVQKALGFSVQSGNVRLLWAMVAFSLFEAAYYSEIIRAGIQSVKKGQISAALALGMTKWQALHYVIMPQAFRNVVPLLLTQGIILFQDTSLVYVMGLGDFFSNSYKVGQRDGSIVEMILFAGAVYFMICFTASLLTRRLQKRFAK